MRRAIFTILIASLLLLVPSTVISQGGKVYYANPAATDQGVSGNRTLYSLKAAIGSTNKAKIILANTKSGGTAYTITTSLALTSNIDLYVESGAYVTGAGQLSGLKYSEVQWFGSAVGAVQKAFDSVAVGGTVKVPQGTTTFSSAIARIANMTVEGYGWGSVLSTNLSPTVATVPALWIQANGVRLKDFKVTWSTMPSNQDALVQSVEQNDTVAIGWLTTGGGKTLLRDVVVENIYVYGAKQHGISIGISDNALIKNNRVEEIYGTGIFSIYTNNIKITGNFVYRTMDAGIDLQGATGTDTDTDNAVISGNIVHSTSIGIGSHGGRGVTISNNVIDNTWASAIYCQASAFYGVAAPFVTNVTGNVIRRPLQFYGVGNFHLLDYATTVSAAPDIIQVLSTSEVNVVGNIIHDDSALFNHSVFSISGSAVSLIGNTATTDATVGLRLGPALVTDYTNILKLTATGNNIKLGTGHGVVMMALIGVAEGSVSGNVFDCGGAGLASPSGRFATASYAKNVIFSGNRVSGINTTPEDFVATTGIADSPNITMLPEANSGILTGNGETWYATTAELENSAHIINTVGKFIGRRAWNGTTAKWVYSTGTAATAVWNDAVGALAHTPIP